MTAPYLKSNYTYVCRAAASQFPFLFISVQDSVCVYSVCVCVLTVDVNEWAYSMCAYVCVCVFWIIYQRERRGGLASPRLRHRGTPLDRMSLLVLLSPEGSPCQTLDHCWIDSCWVSSHIHAAARRLFHRHVHPTYRTEWNRLYLKATCLGT